jgi:hypothetical protein
MTKPKKKVSSVGRHTSSSLHRAHYALELPILSRHAQSVYLHLYYRLRCHQNKPQQIEIERVEGLDSLNA